MTGTGPAIVVFSTLFPSPPEPNAGVFIRERMFRVGQHLPLTVVAPRPWFPLQALIRLRRPGFRPDAPRTETMQGVTVVRPRFFSLPGILKRFDGFFLALAALGPLRTLKAAGRLDVLDAHFAYPDGYAASLLGRWLGVPVTITLRGTEIRAAGDPALCRRMLQGLKAAARVFSVSDSLRRLVVSLGIAPDHVRVVGNGVDAQRFHPLDRAQCRARLGLDPAAPVLVTVGGLTERKGFHRVIECLPGLRRRFPGLRYLIVGGPSAEGDWGPRLRAQVESLGLADCVSFLGPLAPDALRAPLSAADVFVLSTRNEGWANVFLEAMACGLPVVTTDVGGNAEVVNDPSLGTIVEFGDAPALARAMEQALSCRWDRDAIVAYARANAWDERVAVLVQEFRGIAAGAAVNPGHAAGAPT